VYTNGPRVSSSRANSKGSAKQLDSAAIRSIR
jgi:hypothetical protein